jgi:hypothetical protein
MGFTASRQGELETVEPASGVFRISRRRPVDVLPLVRQQEVIRHLSFVPTVLRLADRPACRTHTIIRVEISSPPPATTTPASKASEAAAERRTSFPESPCWPCNIAGLSRRRWCSERKRHHPCCQRACIHP